jgi:hypothetical protein
MRQDTILVAPSTRNQLAGTPAITRLRLRFQFRSQTTMSFRSLSAQLLLLFTAQILLPAQVRTAPIPPIAITGTGDDVASNDRFYHWGALLGYIEYLEQTAGGTGK